MVLCCWDDAGPGEHNQHPLACSVPRRCLLCVPINAAKLPEGFTADMLYERTMQELADEVVEIGKSTDVKCDLDLSLFNLEPQLPTVGPTASPLGSGAEGAGPSPSGGSDCSSRPSNQIVFRGEVGEFVALPTPPNMQESISVGKVLSIAAGDGSDELELRWYMPVRVVPDCRRSEYGKGRWVEEFVVVDGKRTPSISTENIAAVCSTFLKLSSQGKLPKHVWASVAESTLPGAESEEDEEEEQEEGETVDAGVSEVIDQGLPNPPLSALPPVVVPPPRVEPPPHVRRNAAFFRPRRDGTSPNVEPSEGV